MRRHQPLLALLENVAGLLVTSGIPSDDDDHDASNVAAVERMVTEAGYTCFWFLLEPSSYGVPQRRSRVYFLCVRQDFVTSTANVNLRKEVGSVLRSLEAPLAERLQLEHFLLSPEDPEYKFWDAAFRREVEAKLSKTKRHKVEVKWPRLHAEMFEKLGLSQRGVELLVEQQDLSGFGMSDRMAQVFAYDSILAPSTGTWGERVIDLSQSITRYASATDHMPCLTPKGCMFLRRRRRPVLGIESLALQGLELQHMCAAESYRSFSNTQLLDLAGNAFCGAVLQAIVVATWCVLEWPGVSSSEETA